MPIIITIIFRLSTMRVQNAPMQIIVVLWSCQVFSCLVGLPVLNCLERIKVFLVW
jgi:hypothetical protein